MCVLFTIRNLGVEMNVQHFQVGNINTIDSHTPKPIPKTLTPKIIQRINQPNQSNQKNSFNHDNNDDNNDNDDHIQQTTPPTSQTSQTFNPCALLFFGLIKDDFQGLILPSIRTNIIHHNPNCDIFLHTYNLTHVPFNPRSGETTSTKTNVTQAYELTPFVKIDTMEEFYTRRSSILNRSRQFRHTKYESETHDNIIKQWHSIQGVWDLMQTHEAEILSIQQSNVSIDKHYYKRVGLFRSDTFFTDPIPINSNSNTDEVAAIADFGHWGGYNDRMFYGTYENAAVWASGRFNFTPTFETDYMIHQGKSYRNGYHSETFVKLLLTHNDIKPTMKGVCIWRVRAGGKLKVNDCSPNGKGGEDDVIKNLEESGYEVIKKSSEFWETQKNELSDPSSSSSTRVHPPM